jgi:putative peptidoglycan lipid II flippase
VLVAGVPGPDNVSALADAARSFAPGLVGYGLLALLGRALLARGDTRTPMLATVVGWLTVAVLDVVLVAAWPDLDRVVALGIGNTAGMTVAGLLFLVGLRRASPASLHGAGRASAAGVAGCFAAAAVAWLLPSFGRSISASVGDCALLAVVAGGAYLAVVRAVHPGAWRALIRA